MPEQANSLNAAPREPAQAPSERPVGTVSARASLRRSRIGWWVPVFGMPFLLALTAVLVGTRAAPPVVAWVVAIWFVLQIFWLMGPEAGRPRREPDLDRERMLATGKGRTGLRTLDLAQLSSVRRVRWTMPNRFANPLTRYDYVVLTDRAGVRLTVGTQAARYIIRFTLPYQREHGLPEARVSRFAAIGLQLAPDDRGFRVRRTLAVVASLVGYVIVLIVLVSLIVTGLG